MPCFVLPLMHISEKLTEDAWMGFQLCSIDTCDCFIRSRAIGHAAGSTATRPMKDAATWIAGCGEWWIAPHFQASTRRTGLAGERREPCMLMATVRARRAWSLMLIEREDRPSDAGAGDACQEWHRHSACGNSTVGVNGRITCRLCQKGMQRRRGDMVPGLF